MTQAVEVSTSALIFMLNWHLSSYQHSTQQKRTFRHFINLCTVERIFWTQTSCHQLMNSDDSNVVSKINHGHSKNELRQHILREIWFILSNYHFKVKARHVPGKANFISDL